MERRFLALALAAALLACGGRDPNKTLSDFVKPCRSWMATLLLISEERLRNEVPAAYARDSADSALKEIDSSLRPVAQSKAAPPLRDETLHLLTRANAAAAHCRDAFAANDRRAIAAERSELARLSTECKRLQEKLE